MNRALAKQVGEACREFLITVGKYSEDQPRDEHGRWTDGGGASTGSQVKPSARQRISGEHDVGVTGSPAEQRLAIDASPYKTYEEFTDKSLNTPGGRRWPKQVAAANATLKEEGKSPQDYKVVMLPTASVTPSQSGEDYMNASSKETARTLAALPGRYAQDERDALEFGIRLEDMTPIVVDRNLKIEDGNHRHAAAVINGEPYIAAFVPVGPGSGKIVNLRQVYDSLKGKVTKASPSDPFWRRLHAIADKADPILRRKILEAIAQTIQHVDEQALELALGRGDVTGALKAINWPGEGDAQLRAAYQVILGEVYQQSGQVSAQQLSTDLDVPATFNLDHPRAEAWAETVAAVKVMDISSETEDALRAMVTRGFREGIHPRDLARQIRGVKDPETGRYEQSLIGLTERQANAIWNYRDGLEESDRPTEMVDRMVERYRDKLVLQRAENIARTETIHAANEGQQEVWRQAKEQGHLRGTEKREWIVTPDDRACESCLDMDGQQVGLDEEFQDEDGEFDDVLVPPLHPQCRCAVGLVAGDESDQEDEEE